MNRLHDVLSRLRGAGDALFALAVLAVVLLLVAPLPPAALDALLALNLAGAAAILVVTLFARSALGFASFPTLLLLTTQGKKLMDAYMKKDDSAKQTGGWWFNAFGPDGKPLGLDVVKGCYECHAGGAKGTDLVFSKFIE